MTGVLIRRDTEKTNVEIQGDYLETKERGVQPNKYLDPRRQVPRTVIKQTSL